MRHWIVLPIKAPADCKTRLRGVLDDAAREALVADMLHHVVAACSQVAGAAVFLLGPERHGLPVDLLADPGGGLNAALTAAVRAAEAAAVDRITFISADLPHVETTEIARLLQGAATIAPDRAGTGTNALSLPLLAATRFTFHYGADSFARHRAEAERLGLRMTPVESPGLAFDIDLPEDLATASRTS